MADHTQLLRGLLEGCILALIKQEETYGYKVVEMLKISGFADIQESTVYPILKRLEKKELLQCYRKPSKLGPPRKYYKISDSGLLELGYFTQLWRNTKYNVDFILKEDSK